MSHDYNSLLRLAYEIEGLLLLRQRRGADAEVAIDEMLADKIAQLAGDFPVRCAESYSVTEPVHAEEVPVIASDSNDACETSPKAADDAVAASAVEEEVAESNGVKEPVAHVVSVAPVSSRVEVCEADDSQLTLDEKLARQRAKDIFRAFTLNDKFRFRRELFRDSQEEFDDALKVISEMSNVGEAEEYVYDDLCLDPENEAVKVFMDVVIKHF